MNLQLPRRQTCSSASSPSATSPWIRRRAAPTEHERIKAQVEIAKKADEVGLDVVAFGQHHNPPFVASAPTTTMAYVAAQTSRILLDVDDAHHDH